MKHLVRLARVGAKSSVIGRAAAVSGLLSLAALISPVQAAVYNIPAASFILYLEHDFPRDEKFGLFESKGDAYFAALPFAGKGLVCEVRLIYADTSPTATLTARLLKKPIKIGSKARTGPITMVEVKSDAGTQATIRSASTKVMNDAKIDTATSMIYLRVDWPTNREYEGELLFSGFQVDIRDSCS